MEPSKDRVAVTLAPPERATAHPPPKLRFYEPAPEGPRAHESVKQAVFAELTRNRAALRAYVWIILRNRDLVDDAMSDLALEIARCWATYDPALPCRPWLRGIARRIALKRLYKLQRHQRELTLPDDVIETLGARLDHLGDPIAVERRERQLGSCLETLSATNRELLELRYFQNLRFERIAERVQRSVGALYTTFSRLHAALLRCMQKADDGGS